MKKILCAIALTLLVGNAVAVTKCETDSRGRVCCWDTDRDGYFKPLSCF